MRDVVVEVFGPPEVMRVRERSRSKPGGGQVALAVRAAGVTFIETQMRWGRSPGPSPQLPWVPGNAVAGTVDETGDGADAPARGTRVAAPTGGSGGYADRVVVDAGNLYVLRDEVTDDVAVAMLADGRTALSLTESASLVPTDRVLVLAAAGGVGTLLSQLCAAQVEQVIGAAGSRIKVDSISGRAEVGVAVDYSRTGWAAALTEDSQGTGVSVVFDGVGGRVGQEAASLIEAGGRLVVFGSASGEQPDLGLVRERGVEVVPGWSAIRDAAHHRALVERALDAAAEGLLRPTIGRRAPLAEVVDAHRAIAARTVLGKTVLVP